ncbi:uncharacterized protein LOC124408832 [Diprion similis]|uniref:uncharacterized protein LOC124408832 n=1 Tax=Diprion similis TaxID=362088 RepID=UPI001EF945D8|nr:uncharacterized protein LOC124408832 [Diprion similis]
MEITTRELLWKVSELPQLKYGVVGVSGKYTRIAKIGVLMITAGTIGSLISPIGIAIGAIIGGGSAVYFTMENLESIPDVIMMKFAENQKCELAAQIRECLRLIRMQSTDDFDLLVAQNPGLSELVAKTVTDFIESQNMKVMNLTITEV